MDVFLQSTLQSDSKTPRASAPAVSEVHRGYLGNAERKLPRSLAAQPKADWNEDLAMLRRPDHAQLLDIKGRGEARRFHLPIF